MPCDKLPEGVSLKQLFEEFEKFRKGETVITDSGPLGCREALPVLRKHALDVDPKVRAVVTLYLGTAYYEKSKIFYPEVLKLLLRQVQKYPLDKSVFPLSYAANYPCFFFREVKSKPLAGALIARIKYRSQELNRDEIYLLGCLSRREPEARNFLREMRDPAIQANLDSADRQNQQKFLLLALAESGFKEAQDAFLKDFDERVASSEFDKIQSVFDYLKNFTNCRIIGHYVLLITDKREVAKIPKETEKAPPLGLKVGDIAIGSFTYIYGTAATGEEIEPLLRRHSDAEIETIHRRLKGFLKQKVTGSCSFDER